MKIRSLACAVLFASALSSQAFAHPSISGDITIHNGPVSLGLDLSPFVTGWQHAHRHDATCYRNFHRDHRHWGQQFYAPSRDSRREHHHHDRHERRSYSRGHRPSHAGNPHHQPRHHSSSHHRHSRDCHLHYNREHEHWRH